MHLVNSIANNIVYQFHKNTNRRKKLERIRIHDIMQSGFWKLNRSSIHETAESTEEIPAYVIEQGFCL